MEIIEIFLEIFKTFPGQDPKFYAKKRCKIILQKNPKKREKTWKNTFFYTFFPFFAKNVHIDIFGQIFVVKNWKIGKFCKKNWKFYVISGRRSKVLKKLNFAKFSILIRVSVEKKCQKKAKNGSFLKIFFHFLVHKFTLN
jgi:hypothetical protein